MRLVFMPSKQLLALLLLSTSATLPAAPVAGRGTVRDVFSNSRNQIIVVAHRGCHNPAPQHGFSAVPENSLAALDHCVAMGADMMETDVRQTADGYLVIMHDDTVDRTTNGHGVVAEMTLSELRHLRLRDNLGGYDAPAGEERVMTLDEMLQAAKGRILLNLDIKASIIPQVVAAAARHGMLEAVLVKTDTGIGSAALANMAPFDRVPFMPILAEPNGGKDLGTIAEQQFADGAEPIGFELPRLSSKSIPRLAEIARRHHVRLFCNTIGDGFVLDVGGDNDALRDPTAVWGKLERAGISVIQTDRPEALIAFRAKARS
jgi:glycerophosphoryl diester phosphodiesterase